MRRRDLIAGLGGAAVVGPRGAWAQQSAVPVIGVLGGAIPNDAEVARNLAAFLKGLAESGYVEGQNVRIEYRWAENQYDRLPTLAAELVARKVDVIVNEGGAPSVWAAKNATSTIPIVFHTSVDPVATGLIASLARPGGNLTGVSLLIVELTPKLFQLLSELVPKAKLFALLVNPDSLSLEAILQELEAVAKGGKAAFRILKASTEAEINAAFASLTQSPVDGLIVGSDTFFTTQRDRIVALANRHSVPAIYPQALFARAGGLMSYGPSLPTAYRLKGQYVAKILSGVKPVDLPVQEPTTLDLVVNLRTARALNLEMPLIMLQRADEVIE